MINTIKAGAPGSSKEEEKDTVLRVLRNTRKLEKSRVRTGVNCSVASTLWTVFSTLLLNSCSLEAKEGPTWDQQARLEEVVPHMDVVHLHKQPEELYSLQGQAGKGVLVRTPCPSLGLLFFCVCQQLADRSPDEILHQTLWCWKP
ncbi:hypothetical protein GN956_G22805 [Arapaima gigas]